MSSELEKAKKRFDQIIAKRAEEGLKIVKRLRKLGLIQ